MAAKNDKREDKKSQKEIRVKQRPSEKLTVEDVRRINEKKNDIML